MGGERRRWAARGVRGEEGWRDKGGGGEDREEKEVCQTQWVDSELIFHRPYSLLSFLQGYSP